jgi:Sulfotransferase domain
MTQETKIFGIGLSRTGTTTLALALRRLGYDACHFPHDRNTRQQLLSYCENPAQPLQFSAADDYDAVLDTPAAMLYRELSDKYPDSRFILTVRNKQSWLRSCETFWLRTVPWQYLGRSNYAKYCQRINVEVYGRTDFDSATFSAAYDRHVDAVLDWFLDHGQRLLVLDICSGEEWTRLCDFLGRPVPALKFPHINQRGRWKLPSMSFSA